MKMVKGILGFAGSLLLGLWFMGGLNGEDLTFRRNIQKLKKEKWFKELSDNGMYYEKIYQNPKMREYLCQDHIVEKIIHDAKERTYFLSLIT